MWEAGTRNFHRTNWKIFLSDVRSQELNFVWTIKKFRKFCAQRCCLYRMLKILQVPKFLAIKVASWKILNFSCEKLGQEIFTGPTGKCFCVMLEARKMNLFQTQNNFENFVHKGVAYIGCWKYYKSQNFWQQRLQVENFISTNSQKFENWVDPQSTISNKRQ